MKKLDEILNMCPDFYDKESFANGYLKGYKQAEKGLALTWEDINRIEIIIKDVYRDYPHGIEVKQFGMEVLNRFNKHKRRWQSTE